MRKGVILFLLGFFIFQFAYAENEKIDPNQWDFGRVKQGVILEHDFVLKNQTKDILKINSVHVSCECIGSKLDKKSLLPQESTVIKVTFNTKGYSGPVTQFVYADTDNADLSIIKFIVKAQVEKTSYNEKE
jgi:hypothetical protein